MAKTTTNFGHRGFKPSQEPDLTLLDFGQFLIFDDFGQKNTQPYIVLVLLLSKVLEVHMNYEYNWYVILNAE